MKHKIALCLSALVLAASIMGCTQNKNGQSKKPTDTRALVQIGIERSGFKPASIEIKVNDIVDWVNNDSIKHRIEADDGSWKSRVLANNYHYEKNFQLPGIYAYHDSLHPKMKGKIIVKEIH